MKLFCCRFKVSEVKSKIIYLVNWLANEFFQSNCLPPNSYVDKNDSDSSTLKNSHSTSPSLSRL